MGKQPPPLVCPLCKLIRAKHNVVSYRVRTGVHIPHRLLGSRAGMHPHAGKVVAEALLHVLPHRRFQRPAEAGKDSVYAGGRCICLAGRLP